MDFHDGGDVSIETYVIQQIVKSNPLRSYQMSLNFKNTTALEDNIAYYAPQHPGNSDDPCGTAHGEEQT